MHVLCVCDAISTQRHVSSALVLSVPVLSDREFSIVTVKSLSLSTEQVDVV